METSVQCLLKPGFWCQIPGLMRLPAQLTHPHTLLKDLGEGDDSCLPHLPTPSF